MKSEQRSCIAKESTQVNMEHSDKASRPFVGGKISSTNNHDSENGQECVDYNYEESPRANSSQIKDYFENHHASLESDKSSAKKHCHVENNIKSKSINESESKVTDSKTVVDVDSFEEIQPSPTTSQTAPVYLLTIPFISVNKNGILLSPNIPFDQLENCDSPSMANEDAFPSVPSTSDNGIDSIKESENEDEQFIDVENDSFSSLINDAVLGIPLPGNDSNHHLESNTIPSDQSTELNDTIENNINLNSIHSNHSNIDIEDLDLEALLIPHVLRKNRNKSPIAEIDRAVSSNLMHDDQPPSDGVFPHDLSMLWDLDIEPDEMEVDENVENQGDQRHKCDICQRGFETLSRLLIHSRLHVKVKKLVCHICKITCRNRGDLITHYNVHGGGEPAFQCQKCGKSFPWKSSLERHARSHDRNKEIDKDFVDNILEFNAMANGISKNGGRKLKSCPVCGKSFAYQIHLKNHIKCHSKKRKRLNAVLAESSVQSETGKMQKPELVKLKCQYCHKLFAKKVAYDRHMELHIRQTEKKNASAGANNEFDVNEEKSDAHFYVLNQTTDNNMPFKCHVSACGKSFIRLGNLIKHVGHCHGEEEKNFLVESLGSQNGSNDNPTTQTAVAAILNSSSNAKQLKCHECGELFTDDFLLTRHWRLHALAKPEECSKCHLRFSDISSLRRHMIVHDDKGLYQCKQCGKQFLSEFYLARHLKSHSVKKFVCHVCKMVFATNAELGKHRVTHRKWIESGSRSNLNGVYSNSERNEKIAIETSIDENFTHEVSLDSVSDDKRLESDICKTEFLKDVQNGDENEKSNVSTLSGGKMCFLCLRAFPNKLLLSKHIAKCHATLKYECNVCKLILSSERDLIKHFKFHNVPTAAKTSGKTPKRGRNDSQSKLKCSECLELLQNESELESHMKSHITDLKPIICPKCNRTFSNDHDLETHLNICSKEPMFCLDCGEIILNPLKYKEHIDSHDGNRLNVSRLQNYVPVNLIANLRCTICEEILPSELQLEKHMKDHRNQENATVQHMNDGCKNMVYAKEPQQKSQNHADNPDSKTPSDSSPFIQLIEHDYAKREIQNLEQKATGLKSNFTSPSRVQRKCSGCTKIFLNKSELNQHTDHGCSEHIEESKHLKIEDDFEFSESELIAEMSPLTSDQDLQSPCSSQTDLRLKTQHQKQELLTTESSAFLNVSNSKFNPDEQKHKCAECNELFFNVSDLVHHIEHDCLKCESRFANMPRQQFSYVCNHCNGNFFDKPAFNRHVKLHEVKEQTTTLKTNESESMDREKPEENIIGLKCYDCPLIFSKEESLNRHLVDTHKYSKPLLEEIFTEGLLKLEEIADDLVVVSWPVDDEMVDPTPIHVKETENYEEHRSEPKCINDEMDSEQNDSLEFRCEHCHLLFSCKSELSKHSNAHNIDQLPIAQNNSWPKVNGICHNNNEEKICVSDIQHEKQLKPSNVNLSHESMLPKLSRKMSGIDDPPSSSITSSKSTKQNSIQNMPEDKMYSSTVGAANNDLKGLREESIAQGEHLKTSDGQNADDVSSITSCKESEQRSLQEIDGSKKSLSVTAASDVQELQCKKSLVNLSCKSILRKRSRTSNGNSSQSFRKSRKKTKHELGQDVSKRKESIPTSEIKNETLKLDDEESKAFEALLVECLKTDDAMKCQPSPDSQSEQKIIEVSIPDDQFLKLGQYLKSQAVRPKSPTKDKYFCYYCNVQFPSMNLVLAHSEECKKLAEQSNKMYPCTMGFCSAQCKSKSELRYHMGMHLCTVSLERIKIEDWKVNGRFKIGSHVLKKNAIQSHWNSLIPEILSGKRKRTERRIYDPDSWEKKPKLTVRTSRTCRKSRVTEDSVDSFKSNGVRNHSKMILPAKNVKAVGSDYAFESNVIQKQSKMKLPAKPGKTVDSLDSFKSNGVRNQSKMILPVKPVNAVDSTGAFESNLIRKQSKMMMPDKLGKTIDSMDSFKSNGIRNQSEMITPAKPAKTVDSVDSFKSNGVQNQSEMILPAKPVKAVDSAGEFDSNMIQKKFRKILPKEPMIAADSVRSNESNVVKSQSTTIAAKPMVLIQMGGKQYLADKVTWFGGPGNGKRYLIESSIRKDGLFVSRNAMTANSGMEFEMKCMGCNMKFRDKNMLATHVCKRFVSKGNPSSAVLDKNSGKDKEIVPGALNSASNGIQTAAPKHNGNELQPTNFKTTSFLRSKEGRKRFENIEIVDSDLATKTDEEHIEPHSADQSSVEYEIVEVDSEYNGGVLLMDQAIQLAENSADAPEVEHGSESFLQCLNDDVSTDSQSCERIVAVNELEGKQNEVSVTNDASSLRDADATEIESESASFQYSDDNLLAESSLKSCDEMKLDGEQQREEISIIHKVTLPTVTEIESGNVSFLHNPEDKDSVVSESISATKNNDSESLVQQQNDAVFQSSNIAVANIVTGNLPLAKVEDDTLSVASEPSEKYAEEIVNIDESGGLLFARHQNHIGNMQDSSKLSDVASINTFERVDSANGSLLQDCLSAAIEPNISSDDLTFHKSQIVDNENESNCQFPNYNASLTSIPKFYSPAKTVEIGVESRPQQEGNPLSVPFVPFALFQPKNYTSPPHLMSPVSGLKSRIVENESNSQFLNHNAPLSSIPKFYSPAVEIGVESRPQQEGNPLPVPFVPFVLFQPKNYTSPPHLISFNSNVSEDCAVENINKLMQNGTNATPDIIESSNIPFEDQSQTTNLAAADFTADSLQNGDLIQNDGPPNTTESRNDSFLHQENESLPSNESFICSFCGKSFIFKISFDLHSETHNPKRRFECQECRYRFGRYDELTCHLHRHVNRAPYEVLLSRHTELMLYKCDQCDRSFTRKKFLVNHIRIHDM